MRTILPANRDFYTDFVIRQAQFSVQYVHNGRLSLVLLKTRTGILGTPSEKAARCSGLEREGPSQSRQTQIVRMFGAARLQSTTELSTVNGTEDGFQPRFPTTDCPFTLNVYFVMRLVLLS